MSKFLIFSIFVSALISTNSAQSAVPCDYPPSRSDTNGYSQEDLIRDTNVFNQCVETGTALFMIVSKNGAVCVESLPEGTHSSQNILSKAKILSKNILKSRRDGKEKRYDVSGMKMPEIGQPFSFYPIKAGSNQLILSESAKCDSGSTFSAVQGGQYGRPVCQNFSAKQISGLYVQYGKKSVRACRENRKNARTGSSTSDNLNKDLVDAPSPVIPGKEKSGDQSGDI